MAFTMVNSLAESQLSSVVTEVCIYYYVEDGDNKTLVGLVLKDGGRICFSVFPKREGSRDAEIRWCYIPESESRNGVDRRKVLKPNMTVADVRRLLTDLGRGNYTCPPNERANEWWGSVIYKDMVLWGYIPPVPVEESHVAWGGEGKFAYHTGVANCR
ncbi:hypothetical protein AJ79_01303 [Helicocarpus griseus UAMH5409]|uniref:Uncharacterized protein n=1 Tax=Helicocarpus griseus UAMH5409 TaxID=1447875 RepID=A0A2B7Y7F3_9EURO|nr:hypothetical protein AJ79_01303 [Helicocarpus griseus UAMH5409]